MRACERPALVGLGYEPSRVFRFARARRHHHGHGFVPWGHLTHGAPVSHMGRLFNFVRYVTDPTDGSIDFDQVRKDAIANKPKMMLCGYTSYPRDIDYAAFKAIADEVGAISMTDASHFGGLVAGDAMNNPFDFGFDIVTTTTHKSLRGREAGWCSAGRSSPKQLISRSSRAPRGPHMNAVGAIAVTLEKAKTAEFKQYAQGVLDNAQVIANRLIEGGAELVTGGTSNHMIVMNTMTSFGIDGRVAEETLDEADITTNKQIIPDDPNPPSDQVVFALVRLQRRREAWGRAR